MAANSRKASFGSRLLTRKIKPLSTKKVDKSRKPNSGKAGDHGNEVSDATEL
jgi:hypothetical protein